MIRKGHNQAHVPTLRRISLNPRSSQYAGLVSAWLFTASGYQKTISDLKGINDATISGLGDWQETDNTIGTGTYFPSNPAGYIDCGDDASLRFTTGGLTLSCWIRLYQNDGSSGWPNIIAKGNGDLGGANHAYTMYVVAATHKLSCSINGGAVAFSVGSAFSDYQATLHLALTWLPSTRVALFINGLVAGSSTSSIPATLNNPAKNLTLCSGEGNGAGLGSYPFRGMMHEARVYNRALADDEVWQLYAPQTRWDLYRSPVRYISMGAPAAPTGRVFGPAAQTF